MSHTPGSWEAYHDNEGIEDRDWYVGPDGFMDRAVATDMNEANARLISAAPELLEALRNLLDEVDREDIRISSAIYEAERAISKATQE